jgi:hypothetical protein
MGASRRDHQKEGLMDSNVLEIRTRQDLLDALAKRAHRKLTASEILEQRVSWVYSCVSRENGLTRDQIRELLLQREGR